jgi:hypothetical protein
MTSVRRGTRLAFVILLVSCGRRNFNPDSAPVDADVASEASIDARACTLPPAGCPTAEVFSCGGQCFAVCLTAANRAGGTLICEDWGGCLATIQSELDNNCAASRIGSRAWIGARQIPNATTFASDWSWCDGSPLTYTAWSTGEPEDGGGGPEDGTEQCLVLSENADWIDAPCGDPNPFVCSRPL